MRLSKHRSSTHIGMDMMPMIDVTLLLLFFFMTVAQVQNSNKEAIELPKLEGTRDQLDHAVVVNVDDAGRVVSGGREFTVPQIAVWISEEIDRRGGNPDGMKVTIRGDSGSPARTVNEVVRALNRVGVKQVRMAVAAQ